MRHAFALLVLAACAASGPIPGGDKPAWVSTPNGDLRYPPDRFVAAVGSVPVGQKPAPELLAGVDAAARAAVAAQLKQAIAAGFDPAPGIRIEGRWRQGDTAYAWAVFDLAKAQADQAAKVAERQKAAADLLAQGEAAESQQPADALRSYARARAEAAAAQDGAALVRALGGKADSPAALSEAESRVAALLGELTLTVVEGDRQLGAEGKPLPQPVVFSAWLKGKKAVGLPLAATISGGRATAAVVGADGRGEVRVLDAGKFDKEQAISIALDWAALLGATQVPAWIAALPSAGVTAVALRKGVGTTRVLVLVHERIEGGKLPSAPPVAAALTAALRKSGFDVQNGRALLEKFGAERVAGMTDAQVRDAARRVADVVVIGSAVSAAAGASWRARADLRAVEVSSGQVLFQAPAGDVEGASGRPALEALGGALAPPLQAALVKAAQP